MTFTLRPVAATVAVALIGVLVGLALGQLSEANSANSRATASAAMTTGQGRQIIRELRLLNSNLVAMGRIVGTSRYSPGSLHHTLDAIRKNTGEVCYQVGGIGCDRY